MPLAEKTDVPSVQTRAEEKLAVVVRGVEQLADGIRSFEFVPLEGSELPRFTAGSHVDVHLPGGVIRQYSLCNDPAEKDRYVVAVLRDETGRGGSLAMHDAVTEGAEMVISRPRNRFALAEDATYHLFLAGGIGITPIMSMITQARSQGQDFHLYYCTRSPRRTAFLDELAPLIENGQVTVHHDNGDPSRGLDLRQVLQRCDAGEHVYYCGPTRFMDAIEAAAAHWPAAAVHSERFSAPPTMPDEAVATGPFDIKLASTGETFTVQPGETIVEVLRNHGVDVDTSCEEGYCGTCMTRYLEGEPLHSDTVLDEEDREEYVMVCCARAKAGCLVLDL